MTRSLAALCALCLSMVSCVFPQQPTVLVVPLEDLALLLDKRAAPPTSLPDRPEPPLAGEVRDPLRPQRDAPAAELAEYRARVSALERELASRSSDSPARRRVWRLSASTGTSLQFSNSDFGDFTSVGAMFGAGGLVSEHVLLEGFFEGSSSSEDDTDTDSSVFTAGGGGRLYFTSEGTTYPFLGILGGLRYVDADMGGGVDDHDAAPILQARLGAETALTSDVYLEYGLVAQKVFSLDLFGVEDDITTFGAFLGIVIWM